MTKIFNTTALASLLTAVLCCGLWIFPTSAEACCIYNHTTHPLNAQNSMFSSTDISPSNKFCTNGTGGTYSLFLADPFKTEAISSYVNIKVDDHGWISVYKKTDGKWKVVSHRKDGSVKATKYLKPL